MKKLRDKVAIITGATQGIGRATAELFAKNGASVIVNGRSEKRGIEVVKGIRKRGGHAHFYNGDVSQMNTNRELIDFTLQQFGQLDIIVTNAGRLGLGSVTETSVEDWHKTIATNLHSVFYLLKTGIPHMMENEDGGSIVITGSIAAHKGFPNHAAYCATKGAVESLMRQTAVEYAPKIRINLIEPGPVETSLFRQSAQAFPNPDTVIDEVPGMLPMGRTGHPVDIARKMLFLASDDSCWMTGAKLTVDGGASASG